MPGSRSTPPAGATPPSGPRAALQALLDGAEGGTLRRALWLDAVDQLLRPHLPPVLAAHARLANVRGDKLVFVVDGPVWHAKLRLATQELVDAARSVEVGAPVGGGAATASEDAASGAAGSVGGDGTAADGGSPSAG